MDVPAHARLAVDEGDVAEVATQPAFTRTRVQDDGSLLKTNSFKLYYIVLYYITFS